MKKTLSLFLCVLMFLPCFATASAAEGYTMKINIEGSGTVEPYHNGTYVVDSGSTHTFTFTPADGFYLAQVTWNGVPIVVNASNQFVTPQVTDDSTLNVVFAESESTQGVLTFANAFYLGMAKAITFGSLVSLTPLTEGLTEYGVLLHETDKNVTLETNGVKKLQAVTAANAKGQFGIVTDNSGGFIGERYYTRAYAVYNGNAIYGASSVEIDKSRYVVPAALEGITVDTGELYPTFSPERTNYYVLLDNIPASIPTVSWTESDGATVSKTTTDKLSQPITITSKMDDTTISYTVSFRMKKHAVLTSDYFAHKMTEGSLKDASLPDTTKWAPTYEQGERDLGTYSTRTMFHFDSSKVSGTDVQITDATLSLYAKTDRSSGYVLEVLRNTDVNWKTNLEYYKTRWPVAGEEGVIGSTNIDYSSSGINDFDAYKEYTIPLNADGFTDAQSVQLITRAKSSNDSASHIFVWNGTSRAGGDSIDKLPSVTVSYFEKGAPIIGSDANLSALSVDGGTLTPAFDPEITEYYALFDEEPSDIPTISYAVASTSAQTSYTPASDKEGNSAVKVTAEDGTSKIYTVKFRTVKTVQVTPAYIGQQDLMGSYSLQYDLQTNGDNFTSSVSGALKGDLRVYTQFSTITYPTGYYDQNVYSAFWIYNLNSINADAIVSNATCTMTINSNSSGDATKVDLYKWTSDLTWLTAENQNKLLENTDLKDNYLHKAEGQNTLNSADFKRINETYSYICSLDTAQIQTGVLFGIDTRAGRTNNTNIYIKAGTNAPVLTLTYYNK